MQKQQNTVLLAMPEKPIMTFDEASIQGSQSFALALQELRNLRPQLYSAAEYCEASYMYSEQKKVVFDNLKDYSVKALVNVVDHLGTVASKLNDFLDQQMYEIAASEVRVASIAQRLHTCQEYSDREVLRQQKLRKNYSRRHRHYILPNLDEVKREYSTESASDVVREDNQNAEVIKDPLKGTSPKESVVNGVSPNANYRESGKAKGKAGENDADLEARQAAQLEEGRHSWQGETGTLSWLLAAEAKTLPRKGLNSNGYHLQSAAEALFSRESTRAISSSPRSGPIFTMASKDRKSGSSTPVNPLNKIVLNETRTVASLMSFEHVGAQHYRSSPPQNRGILKSFLSRQRNAS
ncbi:hypothetical protein O6H91_23G067700 [Diphasiastrum complanatum]|uniref:Uncharacterized protein n=2 Tax=Diphasiastrum complanatum TaxID=34168 RepID=A0ACC2ABS0_DIPCM|nr:hypothetical protein O6H91_23G067700 [Diphasiastrum complanatum]KAJ7514991.1 hypothetical protein O6H91_23G067700 [Diphasiastrum complanatum]